MKRSTLCISAIGFAALVTACFPDVGNNTPKPNVVVMEFNPPSVVPLPNDLAIDPTTGLIVVPTGPNDTPTQVEFNKTYLGTLDGFPMESTATTTTSGDLAVATLTTGVLVLDITNLAAPFPVATTPSYVAGSDVLNIVPAVTATASTTTGVPFPTTAWTRGHQYAVVVIGGSQAGAVTGSAGQQVIGSSAWALVSGTTPLCAFPDGGPGGPGSGCLPTTDLICQAAGVTGSACAAVAAQLQEIQSGYAPLLNALSGAPFSIPRSNVAILWTFRITTNAEVTFDPANNIIPFPNDLLRTGAGGTINFPIPPTTPDALKPLFEGLNTLDGFSTTATITTAIDFALPNNGVSALMQGQIDPTTLTPQLAWGFQKAPGGSVADQGDPQVAVCVSDVAPGCPQVSATLLDGGVKPEILGIVPLTPLNQLTTYAAYLTNSIKDTNGKPVIPTAIFGLIRLAQPLAVNDSSCPAPAAPCKSTVAQLSNAQAAQLYPLQQGLAPLFAQLTANGIPRSKVVLAWGFQTQTEVSALQQLAAAPYTPDAGLPSTPISSQDVTAQFAPLIPGFPATAKIYIGEIIDLFALTGSLGTFEPELAGAQGRPIPFVMVAPDPTAVPAAGYPPNIFGHGLGGNRTNMLAIATTLVSYGQVGIAIDEPWHGARNTCTGFGAYLTAATGVAHQDTDLCLLPGAGTPSCGTSVIGTVSESGRCRADNAHRTACTRTAADPLGDLHCSLIGQGDCDQSDSLCEGASFLGDGPTAPASISGVPVSGWNLLNIANLFATRDNFRQQVISDSQLARVVSDQTVGASLSARTVKVNPTALNYFGQSLGGILGTLYTSVAFNVNNAGLNVAAGDLVDILLTSPAFAGTKAGFIAGLGQAGIVQDSPTYDLFIDVARWILDPADPRNAAYFLTHKTNNPSPFGPSIPATRRAFVQWIVGDQVLPNPTTRQLIDAALHDPTADGLKVLPNTGAFLSYQFNGSSTPFSFDTTAIPTTCSRHGFLLAPPCGSAAGLTLTTEAQVGAGGASPTQLIGFLTGAAPY